MRVSDLIGADVVDAAGASLGVVTDVRLAQVGRIEAGRSELVVECLLVSTRHTGSLFGYERGRTQGPWLLRTLIRWLHRGAFVVDWSDLRDGATLADPVGDQLPLVLREGAGHRPVRR
jgi:sporulation protein YlmC with PRC-barrel domain